MIPREAYTVSQVNRLIKLQLEVPQLTRIWVIGEITDLTTSRAGHTYFSLKDPDGNLLACTLFAGPAKSMTFRMENGQKVYAMGNISLYEKRGSVQLNVTRAVPAGEGELALQLKQLKEKLQKEGLFDPEHKKPVPDMPAKIGLITSPRGAAIKDFLKMVRDIPILSVMLYPATVQGADAPPVLKKALDFFNRRTDIDVIVMTRGGGSEEDLHCFNDESLARDIFACDKPVLSAIGHEKDTPVCDLVADLRMPTPTAAGRYFREGYMARLETVAAWRESLTVAMAGFRDRSPEAVRFNMLTGQFRNRLERLLPDHIQEVDRLTERLTTGYRNLVQDRGNRLSTLSRALHPDTMASQLSHQQRRLASSVNALVSGMKAELDRREGQLSGAARELNAVNPLTVLERGYSATFTKDGRKLIRSVKSLKAGDTINTRFVDGFALSHVLYTEEKKETP